jgi:hypothetical protein
VSSPPALRSAVRRAVAAAGSGASGSRQSLEVAVEDVSAVESPTGPSPSAGAEEEGSCGGGGSQGGCWTTSPWAGAPAIGLAARASA